MSLAMDDLILGVFLPVAALCAWIDARTFRIPDRLSLGFLALALFADWLDGGLSWERVASAVAVGGVLYLAGSISGAGIGAGDMKLGAAGAYALGLSRSWLMLAVAVLSGLLAFACMAGLRAAPRARLPFGPCLALGALAGALLQPAF